jgi:hypothetical protein
MGINNSPKLNVLISSKKYLLHFYEEHLSGKKFSLKVELQKRMYLECACPNGMGTAVTKQGGKDSGGGEKSYFQESFRQIHIAYQK